MYHQLLPIGEGQVLAEIEYGIDDDIDMLWIESIKVNGAPRDIGEYDQRQIDDIEFRLAKHHGRVVADLNATHRADRAAERADFRECYA